MPETLTLEEQNDLRESRSSIVCGFTVFLTEFGGGAGRGVILTFVHFVKKKKKKALDRLER